MGEVKPFSQREWELAIRMARDARAAFSSHRISHRELRERFDHIRSIVHHPPMSDEQYYWLLEGFE